MDRILDFAAHGFIIYLIVGEFLFMTAGIIIPTFIFISYQLMILF